MDVSPAFGPRHWLVNLCAATTKWCHWRTLLSFWEQSKRVLLLTVTMLQCLSLSLSLCLDVCVSFSLALWRTFAAKCRKVYILIFLNTKATFCCSGQPWTTKGQIVVAVWWNERHPSCKFSAKSKKKENVVGGCWQRYRWPLNCKNRRDTWCDPSPHCFLFFSFFPRPFECKCKSIGTSPGIKWGLTANAADACTSGLFTCSASLNEVSGHLTDYPSHTKVQGPHSCRLNRQNSQSISWSRETQIYCNPIPLTAS